MLGINLLSGLNFWQKNQDIDLAKVFSSAEISLEEGHSDQNLIAGFLRGDQDLFKVLVDRYFRQIYAFIYGYVKDTDAAEDVTQDTFVKVWKNIKKFDRKKSFKVWLYQIAKNTALDFLKKRKMFNFSDLSEEKVLDVIDETASPDDILESQHDSQQISKAMETLPVAYQEVLNLYYRNNFNFREIAEIMKESINTVKSRHRRALLLLKERLNGLSE